MMPTMMPTMMPGPGGEIGGINGYGRGQGGDGVGIGAWPSLVPEGPSGGGAFVAGTSETRRLDELDIASRLSEHAGDAR